MFVVIMTVPFGLSTCLIGFDYVDVSMLLIFTSSLRDAPVGGAAQSLRDTYVYNIYFSIWFCINGL